MNHLDLFSGIGGFALAASWAGINTVAFCEIEPFAQKVLKKNFPSVPVFPDICKLKRSDINETVDIITGGFPCQPFSVAGKKRGADDDRDLWPQMFRVIKEFKPTWVIGENVANFVGMAFQRTKTDLESEGYEVQPLIIPACGVNAPTNETGFGLWRTPTATEGQRGIGQTVELMKQGKTHTEKGRQIQITLDAQVRLWPTPRAFMHKDSITDRGKGNLGEVVGGKLNPDWTEWLMGYPIGWTDLKG